MQTGFHIIAVGGSAGGLEPLQSIISRIPEDINAAIVVVTHLLPTSKSALPDILAKSTSLPVHRAKHLTMIQPGEVYVLPEGKMMTIRERRLLLRDRLPEEKINYAIDIFFKSLADDAGKKATGVVLSGANNDGSEGAKCISEKGGEVFVQDPDTAQFSRMPVEVIISDSPTIAFSSADLINKLLERIGYHAAEEHLLASISRHRQ